MARGQTHYDTLGVDKNASYAEIQTAFKTIARASHPDITGRPDSLTLVTAAWHELKDDARRSAYDATLTPTLAERLAAAKDMRLAAGAAFRHELKAAGHAIWFNIKSVFGQTAEPPPTTLHVYQRDMPHADL